MDDETEKPAVGYQKPPKHTQFQKGKSGNPAGRARGSKNFKTKWREAMAQQVTVKENGVSRQVDVIEAAILALKNQAISKGDFRAIVKLIEYARDYAADEDANSNDNDLKAGEDDILKRFERDLLAQHGVYPELDNDARSSGVS